MNFTSLDGEAIEDKYCMMADNNGEHIYRKQGLQTEECLEWLLSRQGTLCGFGFNYDVNMILGDLRSKQLRELWETHEVDYQGYRLFWIPSKIFRVAYGKQSATICDVWGFFQSSFVSSLRTWGVPLPAGIEEMKAARGTFTDVSKTLSYCIDECKALTLLMGKLDAALKKAALPVRNYVGAGAIAESLLRKKRIAPHRIHDSETPCYNEILTAYFGGRSELFKLGPIDHGYSLDINSAYPHHATGLPSLKDSTWERQRAWNGSLGVWHCKWSVTGPIGPFPIRHKGKITYPLKGSGWYHTCEVQTARRYFEIEITGGWELHTGDEQPFDFIPELFAERKRLKAAGEPAQRVIKLGLNSLYGKLAQTNDRSDKLPPYQCHYWAGLITAATRAQVMDIAQSRLDDLIMIATDGVFFRGEYDGHVPTGDGLGALELTSADNLFFAQPGVYFYRENDKVYGKSRGFMVSEGIADIIPAYAERGPIATVTAPTRRFKGLGAALKSSLRGWRQWTDATRTLTMLPTSRRVPRLAITNWPLYTAEHGLTVQTIPPIGGHPSDAYHITDRNTREPETIL